MIISGAFGLLTWIFLMKPVAETWDYGVLGQLVTLAYPTLDLLVLAMLAWLLTSDGPRNVGFLLIAGHMAVCLIADYLWAFGDEAIFEPYAFAGRLLEMTYLLAYVLYGAGALHPGMAAIGRPVPPGRVQRMGPVRVAVLIGATLIAPALLAGQAWRGEGEVVDAYAIAIGCVTMFLLVVARMAALIRQVETQAVVLEEQSDRLREMAQQDPLTGLPNRRAWNAALPPALRRAARDGGPLALAVLDLDHFKDFNDVHGHQGGDRLLKEAAAVWTAHLRTVDVLARYGGEEFVALLPGADAADAAELIDRLRPLTPMGCTFSAGVAVWDGVETGEELLGRADQALYRAKNAGRARTECAVPLSA
jgi:diguanylate cyclase (GGDEF)-like protein